MQFWQARVLSQRIAARCLTRRYMGTFPFLGGLDTMQEYRLFALPGDCRWHACPVRPSDFPIPKPADETGEHFGNLFELVFHLLVCIFLKQSLTFG